MTQKDRRLLHRSFALYNNISEIFSLSLAWNDIITSYNGKVGLLSRVSDSLNHIKNFLAEKTQKRKKRFIALLLDVRAEDTLVLNILRDGDEKAINITITNDCLAEY